MTQEKITRSTVLNIRRAKKELVVPSTLTQYIVQLEQFNGRNLIYRHMQTLY